MKNLDIQIRNSFCIRKPITEKIRKRDGKMADANTCMRCGRQLERDEKALYRKLFNRGANQFLCLTCQAEHFRVTEDLLREKIEEFREYGCSLFR